MPDSAGVVGNILLAAPVPQPQKYRAICQHQTEAIIKNAHDTITRY